MCQKLKAIDNANPSEALECLETLFDILCEREHTNSEHNFWLKQYNTIKQALIKAQEQEKVLKIVFEKEVDIMWLKQCVEANKTFEDYNSGMGREIEYLTQEEYYLLKEMVK